MSENGDMKAYVAVFVSIFIAELGDKTQLATLLFASDPAVSRVGVFLAAALVASTLLAVLAGAAVGNAIDLHGGLEGPPSPRARQRPGEAVALLDIRRHSAGWTVYPLRAMQRVRMSRS
jgi:hypothetical protein